MDMDRLIEEFGSNHVSGVAGDYVEELSVLCRILNISPVIMDETR